MTWWKQAVFYEIYVRSFQDSNNDGVGDLNGIAARLDYLADLGVDAVWITPFYPSPQVDFGYDVSDYEDVDPMYGTLADFDRLVDASHRRGIKVIIDVVLNHTSDRHPWFQASRSSRSSPYRDWYIWRDGRSAGRPPNNWESSFGGPAWTYDDRTDQWYYHCFYPEQPDLDWRNPAVEQRMFQTLKFWAGRGVDGFRLDAVNTLFEDPALRDNPPLPSPRVTLTGVVTQDFVHTRRMPEVHDLLRRLRRFADREMPGALLVSEAYLDSVDELVRFYGDDDEIHLPFNFFLAQVPRLDAEAFRRTVESIERGFGDRWPAMVLSNHDIVRAVDRLGSDAERDQVAKLLAMLLLTLRGTPFIYYGEEIAMATVTPARYEDVRDPVGRTFWPRYKGRDGVRTPMQWDSEPGAGFTGGTPWLPIAPAGRERNVARQASDPRSVLNFYRALTRLRRSEEALRSGRYRSLGSHREVFTYMRDAGDGDCVLVALNMSAVACDIDLVEMPGAPHPGWSVALGSDRESGEAIAGGSLTLQPFESLMARPR